jgi:1-hydroxycarotenoid 3,4-desaturase
LRLGCGVRSIDVSAGHASGVTLDDGNRITADAVVFNGDAQALAGGLLGQAARPAVRPDGLSPRSLSALTFAIHGVADGFDLSYHNVFFQPGYATEFDDIFRQGRLPRHPTLYLCAQDRAGTEATPPGQPERLFCLINAPARGDQSAPAAEEIEQCRSIAFSHLQRCGLTIRSASEAQVCTTPQLFHQRFPASGGALYGMAPHGWMSSFRRPSAATAIPGLFLAGGSAHPGAGVPMATLSGRLAAATLMAHLDSTRRSARVRISGGMSTA